MILVQFTKTLIKFKMSCSCHLICEVIKTHPHDFHWGIKLINPIPYGGLHSPLLRISIVNIFSLQKNSQEFLRLETEAATRRLLQVGGWGGRWELKTYMDRCFLLFFPGRFWRWKNWIPSSISWYNYRYVWFFNTPYNMYIYRYINIQIYRETRMTWKHFKDQGEVIIKKF